MNMTGTFMPAYGLNSMFGDIPLLGALLGNGRDRGLIGITYRLRGDAKAPQLEVNPLSVIAPGIFGSISSSDAEPHGACRPRISRLFRSAIEPGQAPA